MGLSELYDSVILFGTFLFLFFCIYENRNQVFIMCTFLVNFIKKINYIQEVLMNTSRPTPIFKRHNNLHYVVG